MVSKYYEYATWILGLAVLILALLLIRSDNRAVDSSLDQAAENLRVCSSELAAWRGENPDPVRASAAAQEELSNILKRCAGDTTSTDPADGALTPAES